MATPDQAANFTPKQVLIVEDNELNLRLLRDILELHGYDVFGTRWGSAAVYLARQCRPDVILLDIQLPDISGLEAARQLKADDLTRKIPIIAVTAFAMRGDERNILDSGCDYYISKPFKLEELLETVETFIGRHCQLITPFDAAKSKLQRNMA